MVACKSKAGQGCCRFPVVHFGSAGRVSYSTSFLYFMMKERLMQMEMAFPPLNFDTIVSCLIQLFEATVCELTLESDRDFSSLFCRELDRCTYGQIQLVLTDRDDLKGMLPSLNEQSLKTYVRFGRKTYGALVLVSLPEEPTSRQAALSQMPLLARMCGCLLWMFEFACSAPLPLYIPDAQHTPSLTDRERNVLKLMCRWCSAQEIAQRLGIEVESVERYKRQVRTKLGVEHELKVPLMAYLSGLFSPLTDLRNEGD